VPCSIKTRAYRRLRETVSRCRKSAAMMPWAWAVRNWRQVGPERCGAGSMPAACRISQTVDGAISPGGEFAVNPPVAPGAVLAGQAQDELLDDGRGRRSPGAAVLGERPLADHELTVPGQQCGGGDREDLAPALPRDQPGECGEPHPVGGLVPDPGDLTAQQRVLMPHCQHLRVLGHAAAQHCSGHGDQFPDQRSDDRQRHPHVVPERSKPRRQDQRTTRPQPRIVFSSGTGCRPSSFGHPRTAHRRYAVCPARVFSSLRFSGSSLSASTASDCCRSHRSCSASRSTPAAGLPFRKHSSSSAALSHSGIAQ
jgi:hypothetical protein